MRVGVVSDASKWEKEAQRAYRTPLANDDFDFYAVPRSLEGFRSVRTNTVPAGWTVARKDKWIVTGHSFAPSTSNVLEHQGGKSNSVALNKRAPFKDGFVETKMQTASATGDSGGGLVWRAKDAKNYYTFNLNPRQKTAAFVKVTKGQREILKSFEQTTPLLNTITPDSWHILRVEFEGPVFRIFLDETFFGEATDPDLGKAGQVGLEGNPGSLTLFDDFSHSKEEVMFPIK